MAGFDAHAAVGLQGGEVGQQRRDLGGGVLVHAVQADDGVEDDEARPQAFDLGEQAGTVPRPARSRPPASGGDDSIC